MMPERRLEVVVPPGHSMHSAEPAAASACRLFQMRLDELCADLDVESVEAVRRDGVALALKLDDRPLRVKIVAPSESNTAFTPRANQIPALSLELFKAEIDCRHLLDALLAQRADWAPAQQDSADRDAGLHTLPKPPPRLDLLVADLGELGETGSPDGSTSGAVSSLLFEQLGLTVPPPVVRVESSLASGQYRVCTAGVRSPPRWGPLADEWMVYESIENLQKIFPEEIGEARPFRQPWGAVHTLMPASDALRQRCDEHHLIHAGPHIYRLMALVAHAHAHAASLINNDGIAFLLQRLEEQEPALVREAAGIGLPTLTAVARALLEERVPIRGFAILLQAMVAHRDVALAGGGIGRVVLSHADDGVLPDPAGAVGEAALQARLLAAARKCQVERLAAVSPPPSVLLLHNRVEAALVDGLNGDLAARLRRALQKQFEALSPDTPPPVIVTAPRVRRSAWEAVRVEFPRLVALASSELPPNLVVHPIATVDFAEALPAAPH